MTEHKSKLEAVGFIGLGIMGLPMVRNLLKEGIEVLAYDLNQASLDAAMARALISPGKASPLTKP